MRLITEYGPPKSGKTKRLIEAANAARQQGQFVYFITHENTERHLRDRGLHFSIPIKQGSHEAVEVHAEEPKPPERPRNVYEQPQRRSRWRR